MMMMCLTHNVYTGKEIPMLCGNLVGIVSGGVIAVILSLFTNRNYSTEQGEECWEKTRDIDSPLLPWAEVYAK